MDIRDTTIDAIILKSRDYKEQDKLLTYFSLEKGKGAAVARGAAKPGGSLRNIAQPFCRVSLTLSPARNSLSYISQGLPDTSYVSLDASLSAIAYASYISELTDISMPERRPSADFFALLLATFSLLKLDANYSRTARFFELRLIREMGLMPDLTCCGNCGRTIRGGSFRLSPKAGALLCAACGTGDTAPLLCAGAVQTMRRLLDTSLVRLTSIRIFDSLMNEMERSLTFFLDYHLDYSIKAKSVLQQLLD